MIPIKGSAPSPKRPPVTIALIAINSLVFLFEASMPTHVLEQFIRVYGFVPKEFWASLATRPARVDLWLWPILTSMFLHGGWAHLIGNMLFLWVFGDGVENRIGSWRFIAFYLAVGVAATITHGAIGPSVTTPTIGASGAIAGVLGAYLLMYPKSRVVLVVPIFFWPFFFQVPTIFFLGFWFLEQLFFGAVSSLGPLTDQPGGVAWWAHAGGFLAGLVLGLLVKRGKPPPEVLERPRLFPDRSVDQPPRHDPRR